MKQGIDISAWQGTINFEKVKSAVDFIIIRAGFGQGTIDKRFKSYISECNRLSIPVGVYWFSYAYSIDMAKKEAEYCLKAVSPYKLDYPIFWDFEYDSCNFAAKKGVKVTKKLVSDMARAFMCTIKAAGYQAGNYTNLDFSKRYFDEDVLKNYPLWAARYTKTPVDIVNGAALWQYSSTGKIKGITGNVDLDYALVDFASHQPTQDPPEVETKPALDAYRIPSMYSLVFDPDYYVMRYEDLRDAVEKQVLLGNIPNRAKNRAWWLYQHFLKYGMAEGRQGVDTFDVNIYRAKYKDLQEAFGDDLRAYYYHYMQYGAEEIQQGKR